MEIITAFILNPLVLMFLGLIANFLQRLIESNDTGEKITPIQYIKQNPYRIGLSIIGVLVGYALLLEFDKLTTINALTIGYINNNVIEMIANKASSNIKSLSNKS